jgi:hypothetical protein
MFVQADDELRVDRRPDSAQTTLLFTGSECRIGHLTITTTEDST